jgi:hypothetical protein
MKTLKYFNTIVEAGLARAELGAAGIEAWSLDEADSTAHCGGASLGVRLGVKDGDYEAACLALGVVSPQRWEGRDAQAMDASSADALRAFFGAIAVMAGIVSVVILAGLLANSLARSEGVSELSIWFGFGVLAFLGAITYYLARIANRRN